MSESLFCPLFSSFSCIPCFTSSLSPLLFLVCLEHGVKRTWIIFAHLLKWECHFQAFLRYVHCQKWLKQSPYVWLIETKSDIKLACLFCLFNITLSECTETGHKSSDTVFTADFSHDLDHGSRSWLPSKQDCRTCLFSLLHCSSHYDIQDAAGKEPNTPTI